MGTICPATDDCHNYQPRYQTEPLSDEFWKEVGDWETSTQIQRAMEIATHRRQYVGDVCTQCGDVVFHESDRQPAKTPANEQVVQPATMPTVGIVDDDMITNIGIAVGIVLVAAGFAICMILAFADIAGLT